MDDKPVLFNGIDGTTGRYLLSLTAKQVAALARGEQPDPSHLTELRRRAREKVAKLAPIPGVSTSKLDEAGWGVVFPKGDNSAVKQALEELLSHRRRQAGEGRYYEFDGDAGWWPNEDMLHFLRRHGSGPGPVDPDVMPYYLLLVGSPEEIPFSAQYQLDVQHAVGRLHFDDLDGYARYAHSVVLAEEGEPRPRTAALVGVRNPDDPATELSATKLIPPLAERLRGKKSLSGWRIQPEPPETASKAELLRLLGGDRTPTFLFTASHGMGFPYGHERQREEQGALLCQDWPGPEAWRDQGPIPREFYLAAADIADGASLLGTIAFHFACFGAGTPLRDDFAHHLLLPSEEIAPKPFIAELPKRLLGHPSGGALAVIGHVERAWGYSVEWDETAKIDHFLGTIQLILEGQPVGAALDFFNVRYAELSSHLTKDLDESRKFGRVLDDIFLADLWTANNDARSYVIVGDPATRLKVGDVAADAPRPVFGEVRARPAPERPPVSARPVASARVEQATPAPTADAVPAAAPVATVTATATPTGTATATATVTLPMAAATAMTGAPATTPEAAGATGPVSFGVNLNPLDWIRGDNKLKDAVQHLADSVTEFADKLGEALQQAVTDASSLTVTTYVSPDIGSVKIVGGVFTGPVEVRAMTQVAIDGDTDLCVPRDTADLRDGLWTMHADMVERAQANRTELLKAAVSAATGLLATVRTG